MEVKGRKENGTAATDIQENQKGKEDDKNQREGGKKEEKGLAPLGVLTANHTGLGLGQSSERCNEPSEELVRKKTMSDEWVA